MKIWDKDNWKLLALLFYCFVLAYFAPGGFARIGFLPLLLFAFKSRNNAFWIVLLLVFVDNPAYFFHGTDKFVIGRTPLYPFIGGGISFNELLAFTLIAKSLTKNGNNLLYSGGNKILVIVVLSTLFISFAFSVSAESIIIFARRMTIWIFMFSLPRLLSTRNDWLMFFKLLFPFAFLVFFDQLQIFLTGKPIAGFFNPDVATYHAMREVIEGTEQVSRALSGPVIIFIGFAGALLLFLNDVLKSYFRPSYLILVAVVIYLVILLSATRGWFLSLTFMFLLTTFISGGRQLIRRIVPYTVSGVLLAFIVVGSSPVLQTQLTNAWIRISTLEQVAQGDFTAGGTVGRWTDVAPRLLKHVADFPFGYGFTNLAFSLENDHAGIVNPMIIFGVQGYALILFVVFLTMFKLVRIRSELDFSNPFSKSALVAMVFFIGLFVIHLTSRQIFGLNRNVNYNLLVPIIFGMANWMYVEAVHYHNSFLKAYKNT
jgi:hypothetical protein